MANFSRGLGSFAGGVAQGVEAASVMQYRKARADAERREVDLRERGYVEASSRRARDDERQEGYSREIEGLIQRYLAGDQTWAGRASPSAVGVVSSSAPAPAASAFSTDMTERLLQTSPTLSETLGLSGASTAQTPTGRPGPAHAYPLQQRPLMPFPTFR